MINKIRTHPTHIVLGVGMIVIGLWLILNNHFFTWPPNEINFVNDDIWGALFVFDGTTLLVWVFEGDESVKWNRRLLTATAFLMGFLTTYQFVIWVATGVYISWISNTIITAFVLICARRSDTRHG